MGKGGPPRHFHYEQDEWFYALKGEFAVEIGNQQFTLRPGELFAHVLAHVPAATTVLGNSWLYNLAAYRRLFPPAYTAHLPASDEDEFQYLALWGQCSDRAWQPRPDIVSALFERVEMLTELASLRHCFPYQILQPECPIGAFYTEYGLEMGASEGAGPSPG